MKFATNSKTYTSVSNISFSPSVDISENRMSIDECTLEVITYDEIFPGKTAYLRNAKNDLFFKGHISHATRNSDRFWKVKIRSDLSRLDKVKMTAAMYSNEDVDNLILTMANRANITIGIAANASGKKITGFCPEQSARDRLHWILITCGLFVLSSFVEYPTVFKLDTTNATVPKRKTFWRPQIEVGEYIKTLTVTSYSFAQREPESGEESVEVGNVKYVVSKREVSLTDLNVPAYAAQKTISIDGIMLINDNNVDTILSALAAYYFKRTTVDFTCINNSEYTPGSLMSVHTDNDEMYKGYASEMSFTFGLQSKSRVKLVACELQETAKLKIQYVSMDTPPGTLLIARREYVFPTGYTYSITTEYISVSVGAYDYVFRPSVATITGEMQEGMPTVIVQCFVALKRERATGILEVISVDSVDRVEYGTSPDLYYVAEID